MKTYEVRTYGCQMNVHDSERLSGLLETAGYARAESGVPDLVVFNTCAVRENADNKLYGNLGRIASVKATNPGMQIAVGGCLAQKDRDTITQRAPYVDVVFGTHNIGSLPVLLERARIQEESQVEILEALEVFPSTLPTKRDSVFAAWVSISVGCNNTCTFCIVPSLRGKEKDRRPGDVLAEVESLVADGVVEVTLLGQNVNSYGAEFRRPARVRQAAARLRRHRRARTSAVHQPAPQGLHRRRHRRDGRDAQRHAPAAHATAERLRPGPQGDASLVPTRQVPGDSRPGPAAMPDAAISTDIIVGFPGETDDDFEATLDVVREARYATAFTFKYSQRPGTPAASLPDQVPHDVVQERYDRLAALVNDVAWEENRRLVGSTRRAPRRGLRRQEGRRDAPAHRPRPRQPPRALRPR